MKDQQKIANLRKVLLEALLESIYEHTKGILSDRGFDAVEQCAWGIAEETFGVDEVEEKSMEDLCSDIDTFAQEG